MINEKSGGYHHDNSNDMHTWSQYSKTIVSLRFLWSTSISLSRGEGGRGRGGEGERGEVREGEGRVSRNLSPHNVRVFQLLEDAYLPQGCTWNSLGVGGGGGRRSECCVTDHN